MNLRSLFRGLAQHPYVSSAIVGLLATTLILVLAALVALQNTKSVIHHNQARASQLLMQVSRELDLAFTQLEQEIKTECSSASLLHMQQSLLTQQHIRAFGMLNQQGQLVCITSEGLLPAARSLPAPNLKIGQESSWYAYPVNLTANTPVRTMNLVAHGRFVALLESRLPEQILQARNLDAIWISTRSDAGSQTKLIWAAPQLNTKQLVQPYYPERRYESQLQQWATLDWSQYRMVVGSNVPMTAYFVQNYVPLWGLLLHNRIITMSVLALAALIGILLGFFAKLKLEQFNSLSFRIRDLCQPEHIVCMYQPIIDLRTGQICGCEVLMRLQENGKIIFPDQAIPLIQAQNLTWALDSAVTQKALSELQQFLPANTVQPFKVALNYFPENITHQRLSTLLQPLQDPRFALNIEVTEYGVSEDLFADVQKLRQQGYLISVDDFGTGYSNLGTVKRLAPDYLKIDRSFVFDMEDDSLRSSLIPEIVAIAGAVGAEVIAEGIENESQAQRLQAMGVQFGQGYWYGKPQPIAVFIAGLNKAK